MGSLEDHYAAQEAAQQAQLPTTLERYNTLVSVYQEISGKMLTNVKATPPQRYDWIEVDGRRLVGWQFYRDYDYTYLLYFLSDGRLVRVKEDSSRYVGGFYAKVGVETIDIQPLDRPMTEQEIRDAGRISLYLLRELCQSIVSHVPANYGFPNDPNWKRWHDASR